MAKRLGQVGRKLNVGIDTMVEFLSEKGFKVNKNPNSKINQKQSNMLEERFANAFHDKEEASEVDLGKTKDVVIKERPEKHKKQEDKRILIKDNVAVTTPEKISARTKRLDGPKVVGKIDLYKDKTSKTKRNTLAKGKPQQEGKKELSPEKKHKEVIKGKADSLPGLKVVDKIKLPTSKANKTKKPVASSDQNQERKKRPRKRISPVSANRGQRNLKQNVGIGRKTGRYPSSKRIEDLSDKEIQDKIKATLAKLSEGKPKTERSKHRKDKRSAKAEEERQLQAQKSSKTLQVTEFISANDLASLMDVTANEVISSCMSLGIFASINQRLDADTITVVADEFGFDVDFAKAKEETDIVEVKDDDSSLKERAPIVTIMGHVDHGKTSLLDFIRNSKITADEAGGITQHIGAYDVTTDNGKHIAFLDTPGHEAFTAMRARGAKLTDIAIIVIAADDSVMPQTKEAINHAQVAGVPIVIAINKMDKPNADPDKIKESLSNMNILVEDWGGKYQCQHVSAKTGEGIESLLDKVLIEAELLELKANSEKPAVGSVIEASLDKGRGFVSTIMVQAGTLRVGNVVLAGPYFGKVKAMFDHRGHKLTEAGPSTPIQMLGLDGAPQAGDRFNVMENEREAREIATKREQILREQSIRTKKHITLDEIGRRLSIGNFKELGIIVKGDVDGSIEALSDALLNLSTEEVQVTILHRAVGQISESDVLLASASDAIIVGFQVRPSAGARKLAEAEEIEIRLYSVIYDAINEVKDAIEGMLEPTSEEVVTGNIEVREVFKISKIGTVAGCYVTEGIVKRSNQVRLIRNGIVVYTGDINQLKRFKDDVSEVKFGYECGLSIKNFNDIKVGDTIEGFEIKKVKRKL